MNLSVRRAWHHLPVRRVGLGHATAVRLGRDSLVRGLVVRAANALFELDVLLAERAR